MDESVAIVQQMIASKRPHHVVTANVDFLVQSLADRDLHRIFLHAHLLLCDGTPLIWASRFLGNPLPERVAGADLAPKLIKLAEEKKYRIYLLGGSYESNTAAVRKLKQDHPNLIIAGNHSPPFAPLSSMDHADICKRIRLAKPDILLVSFGCPKQEKWIARHHRTLGVPVSIGVGAVIDFFAQRVKRAPVWMQRSGTEWIFRLLQEPKRLFRRYLVDLYCISFAIISEQWHIITRTSPPIDPLQELLIEKELQWHRVQTPNRLDSNSIQTNSAIWHNIRGRNYVLDLENVGFIDGVGVGLLIRLHHRLKQEGHMLLLSRASKVVCATLNRRRLNEHFNMVQNDFEASQAIANHRRGQNLPSIETPELN